VVQVKLFQRRPLPESKSLTRTPNNLAEKDLTSKPKEMKLYFITKHFQARRMEYDEEQNVLWLDPNFKERFFKRHQVGFNLNLLRSIEEYPALSKKVEIGTLLVYFTLHLKDMKVAIGVDEDGLAFMNRLKVPNIPNISGSSMIQRELK